MRLLPFQKYTKNGQKEIVIKYVTISLGGTWNEETQENTSIKHNEGIQPLELMDDILNDI